MHRLILSIILLFVLVTPASAQGPIFLPWMTKGVAMPTCDDHWKLIRPEATTNYALNPSGETTGNFAAAGGAVTRSTTYSKYGLYSYYVQSAANHDGLDMTLAAVSYAVKRGERHFLFSPIRRLYEPEDGLSGL